MHLIKSNPHNKPKMFAAKLLAANVEWICANWKVLCAAPVGSFCPTDRAYN